MNWQPISTCPLDNKPMDVWKDGEHYVDMVLVETSPGNVYWTAIHYGCKCVRNPTHWMRVEPPEGVNN